jgi:hypothetical protein
MKLENANIGKSTAFWQWGIYLLFFSLLTIPVEAQRSRSKRSQQRFKAGVFLGINAAQIDGDQRQGYNKGGLQTGLRGVAILDKRNEISIELAFSQRGSKSTRRSSSSATRFSNSSASRPLTIGLAYADASLFYNFLTSESYKGHYALHLHTGLTFSRLLSSEVEESRLPSAQGTAYEDLEPFFRRNSLNWIFGGTIYPIEELGFTIRHGFELTPVFKREDFPSAEMKHLLQYFLSFHAVYMFK